MEKKSNYDFELEKLFDKIRLIAFLFLLSRILDYVTTYIAINLGFTENTRNWLYYGIDNWYAFWIIQIIITFIVFYLLYRLYFYLDKSNSVYLKFISILIFWSWFIISWTVPIHNAIHITYFMIFDTMSVFNFSNILNLILIGIIFISLSLDILDLRD